MAVVQLRNATEGRAYFDAKKAAGKTSLEAMRALKRRLSNVVYARMAADQKRREAETPAAAPGGHSGTTLQSSVTGLTPHTGPSDKPHPGPTTQPRPAIPSRNARHMRVSRGGGWWVGWASGRGSGLQPAELSGSNRGGV